MAETVRTIVLAGAEEGRDLTTMSGYREVGGYDTLTKARGMEPQAVLDDAGFRNHVSFDHGDPQRSRQARIVGHRRCTFFRRQRARDRCHR